MGGMIGIYKIYKCPRCESKTITLAKKVRCDACNWFNNVPRHYQGSRMQVEEWIV